MSPARLILPTTLALLLAWSPVRAEELTPQKRADIEQLLEVTGALKMGTQMSAAVTQQLLQNLRRTRPDIPSAVLDLLPGEVAATFSAHAPGFIADEIVPIYHRHFTGQEVRELMAFYATPLGRKSLQAMPSMMQESMAAGQRWGQSLAPEIMQRVTDKLRQQGVKI